MYLSIDHRPFSGRFDTHLHHLCTKLEAFKKFLKKKIKIKKFFLLFKPRPPFLNNFGVIIIVKGRKKKKIRELNENALYYVDNNQNMPGDKCGEMKKNQNVYSYEVLSIIILHG